MGCGGGQNHKTAQEPKPKDGLLSILPEGSETACSKKLAVASSAPPLRLNPADAVWKELSTNDESLSRKDVLGSHKHVKSTKPFTEDLSAHHKPKATRAEEMTELDKLLRDLD